MTSTLTAVSDHGPGAEDEPTLVVRRPGEDGGGGSRRGSLRLVEGALAGLALLLLVFSVLVLGRAQDHDRAEVDRAALRDEVLITARSEIETLNSMDHRDVDAGLKAWQQVTTGQLKDQIVNTDATTRDLVASQKYITTGRVVDAAVTELDSSSATVIAAVETTVRDDSGTPGAPTEPSVKRNRFVADLVKVGGRWLLASVEQVKVGIE